MKPETHAKLNHLANFAFLVVGAAFCALCWFVVLVTSFGTRAWLAAIAAVVFGIVSVGSIRAVVMAGRRMCNE